MLANHEIVLRLVISALLGSLIGIERERRKWTAGLRTHMLVSVGATLFMIVSAFGFSDILGYEHVELDASRIAAQVVSGIGFLGAGTIILRREVVRGLTTAASLWTVAAVGLAVGGGLYVAAFAATLLILLILAGLKPLEKRLAFVGQPPQILLLVDRKQASLTEIEAALEAAEVTVKRIQIERGRAPDEDRMRLTVNTKQRTALTNAIDGLRLLPGVRKVSQGR